MVRNGLRSQLTPCTTTLKERWRGNSHPQEQRMETNVLDVAAGGDKNKTETSDVRRGDVKSTVSLVLATSQNLSNPAYYRHEVKGNVTVI